MTKDEETDMAEDVAYHAIMDAFSSRRDPGPDGIAALLASEPQRVPRTGWLWRAGWNRGAEDSLSLAREAAEEHLRKDGDTAVVDMVEVVRGVRPGKWRYRQAGCRTTGRRSGAGTYWMPLGPVPARSGTGRARRSRPTGRRGSRGAS